MIILKYYEFLIKMINQWEFKEDKHQHIQSNAKFEFNNVPIATRIITE